MPEPLGRILEVGRIMMVTDKLFREEGDVLRDLCTEMI